MPEISRFNGIIIAMYCYDNDRHHLPHIHAYHSGDEAVFAIDDGAILRSSLPSRRERRVREWINANRSLLLERWALAVCGKQPPKIGKQ